MGRGEGLYSILRSARWEPIAADFLRGALTGGGGRGPIQPVVGDFLDRVEGDGRTVGVGHLVVRAPNWVGDLVMATPILEAAVRDRRFGRVTIAVRSHLVGVLTGGPLEEHVLRIPDRREEVSLLRGLGADAVLLLTNSPGASWRALRAGIRIRAGVSLGGRGLLLTHRVIPPTRAGRRAPIPTAHLQRDVAGLLGILVPDLTPKLHVTDAEREEVREMLVRNGVDPGSGYVLCAPGAAFGAAKLWPPEYHAAVLDGLAERTGWTGVISGGPGEEETMGKVLAATTHGAVSLADERRDLRGLKALVEGARMLLVGDSGPRWYAAAFGVPCVTIMGPNFPELTATSFERCEVVRRDDLECQPCIRRSCPLGHHRCMRDLPPARALEAAERLLAVQAR